MSEPKVTYYLRNFNHKCCYKWLQHCLAEEKIPVINWGNGFVTLYKKDADKSKNIILREEFVIIEDKNLIKVEKIKQAVYELIQLQSHQNSIIQKSEYLIEKLNMSYPSISKLFSKYEPITLEKYIIKHKVRKIIDLTENEDYTLSEIAYMMDYSSVQHLSNQFKKETGYTFSEFKNLEFEEKQRFCN